MYSTTTRHRYALGDRDGRGAVSRATVQSGPLHTRSNSGTTSASSDTNIGCYYLGGWWTESQHDRLAGVGVDVALAIDDGGAAFRLGVVATATDSSVFVSTFSHMRLHGVCAENDERFLDRRPRHTLQFDNAASAALVGTIGADELTLSLSELKGDGQLHVETVQSEWLDARAQPYPLTRVPPEAAADIFALTLDPRASDSQSAEDQVDDWMRQESALRRWARKKRRERFARRPRHASGQNPRARTVW